MVYYWKRIKINGVRVVSWFLYLYRPCIIYSFCTPINIFSGKIDVTNGLSDNTRVISKKFKLFTKNSRRGTLCLKYYAFIWTQKLFWVWKRLSERLKQKRKKRDFNTENKNTCEMDHRTLIRCQTKWFVFFTRKDPLKRT